ncbi:MAG: peptidylprolyl isomerase [bacterium]
MKEITLITVFVVSIFANPLQAQAQTKTVALVNDVPILEAKLIQALKPYKDQIAGSKTVYLKIREKVLNELIEEELLLQEAKAKEIVIVQAEIEQIISVIRSRFESEEKFGLEVKTNGMSMVEFREKIKEKLLREKIKDIELKGRLRLTLEELNNFCKDYGIKVHAQHILVKTKKEALDILHQAQAGVDFTQLAIKHSLCPSHQVGGDLGFFGRGQMVREFENAAFAMNKEGQLSDVVETKFGYHIIRFIAKKDPTQDEIEEIKTALLNELHGRTYLVTGEGLNFEIKRNLEEKFIGKKLELAYETWLLELKNKAKIKIMQPSDP